MWLTFPPEVLSFKSLFVTPPTYLLLQELVSVDVPEIFSDFRTDLVDLREKGHLRNP